MAVWKVELIDLRAPSRQAREADLAGKLTLRDLRTDSSGPNSRPAIERHAASL